MGTIQKRIKARLIWLAIQDKLPVNMNELDESVFDDCVSGSEITMLDFCSGIDFGLLKEQKQGLLKLLDSEIPDEKAKLAIEGTINLIDSIQDIAVDKLGYNEGDVFTLVKMAEVFTLVKMRTKKNKQNGNNKRYNASRR